MNFSIIIATCGRPERLRVTLERVAAAIDKHGGGDEILVVDNSPEAQLSTFSFQLSAFPNVRFLRSKPLNKCAALNVGIAAAKHEWLAFTDDDCLPAEDWLVAADGFVEQGVCRAFGGKVFPVGDESGLPQWLRPGRRKLSPGHGSVVRYDPEQESGIVPSGIRKPLGANFFCRRDVFEGYGLYDEGLWDRCGRAAIGCDDGEMMLRLDASGEPVGYCAEAVVDHPIYADRATIRNHLRAAFRLGYREPIVEGVVPPVRWLLRRVLVDAMRSMFCFVTGDHAAAVHYAEKVAVSWGTLVCVIRGRKPL